MRNTSRKSTSSKFDQGIGYHVPRSVGTKKWRELKKEWDAKLAESGVVDIEYFAPNSSGHFSPFFKARSGMSLGRSSNMLMLSWSEDKQEYYRFCSVFLQHYDWNSTPYPASMRPTLRRLWDAHCNGFSASQALQATGIDLSVSYTNNLLRALRKIMFRWHTTHPEGLMYRSDI